MSRITSFKVIGKGPFPVDMLRYDQAWPRDGESAAAILTPVDRAERAAQRELQLCTDRRNGPTFARWASFGWTVTECFDEHGNAVSFVY